MDVTVTVRAADGTTQNIVVPVALTDPGYVAGWGVPVWRDEFAGPTIDTTKWRIRDNTYMSYDIASIVARNAAIVNGQLVITGKVEQLRLNRPYTTAYLDTIGKSSFKFGRWEMRAKINTPLNTSRGIWPAFWLRADSKPGEIDIMEAWGTPADNPQWLAPGGYTVTIHADTNKVISKAKVDRKIGPLVGQPQLSDAFHTYAVEWDSEKMVFLLDGVPRQTITKVQAGEWFTTSMDDTFNIRLNLQVGCDYQGNPDAATTFPTYFIVDYVRYWAPVV